VAEAAKAYLKAEEREPWGGAFAVATGEASDALEKALAALEADE
jgi:hypothetical protein